MANNGVKRSQMDHRRNRMAAMDLRAMSGIAKPKNEPKSALASSAEVLEIARRLR
jgi:hypothetical protein